MALNEILNKGTFIHALKSSVPYRLVPIFERWLWQSKESARLGEVASQMGEQHKRRRMHDTFHALAHGTEVLALFRLRLEEIRANIQVIIVPHINISFSLCH